MRIFTWEFEVWVRGLIFCSWRGHKMPKRYQLTWWAVGHMGLPTKFCVRCGKELKTKKMTFVYELQKRKNTPKK
jgi:hypothetical protein